jgi:hypothetical protein
VCVVEDSMEKKGSVIVNEHVAFDHILGHKPVYT